MSPCYTFVHTQPREIALLQKSPDPLRLLGNGNIRLRTVLQGAHIL